MPLTKKEKEKAIVAQLRLGKKPIEIKESCEVTDGLEDIALSYIYKLNREYNNNLEKDIVPELSDLPLDVVSEVVRETKTRVMLSDSKEKGDLIGALSNVIDAKKGLEYLNRDFQATFTNALEVFDRHLSDPDLPLKDAQMIMNTVAKAHMDIFSSTTNIHIGDNNTDNKKQSIFQSEMRS